MRVLLVLVVAVLGAAAPSVASADDRPVRPRSVAGPLGDARLSDERRLSRVAGVLARSPVRELPTASSPVIGRLRFLTEDGPFEVYPVLESRVAATGRTWLRVRLPARPNGRTGWVPRTAMGPLRIVETTLRIDRTKLRATLRRRGRIVWSSPIGVGARSTPTPAGPSWVRSRLRNLRDSPEYGPYAFGTGTYSVLSDWPGGGVVGIHGTDEPERIPGRPSHGCIRVPNAAITRLWRLLPVGTPIVVV